jgi:hypothetical protein
VFSGKIAVVSSLGAEARSCSCSTDPHQPALRAKVLAIAREISGNLLPRTRACTR